jgi:3-phenylpropionate/trans-cinnamate dioxygenase ferredoxin subunit
MSSGAKAESGPAPKGRRHPICRLADFPAGSQRQVQVGSRAVAVFHLDDRFYALRDACPHQGAALSAGTVVSELRASAPGEYRFDAERKCVRCPWHGWEYDLESGHSYYDPAHDRVRAYAVAVEPDAASRAPCRGALADRAPVRGPYTAEPVEIALEDSMVVLYA